ncbi:MAG TPA: hypothetical protein VE891_09480 [Allosphingosinicella sp.]|nr:hypothetical protein [Allosphingosinicella sp.]
MGAYEMVVLIVLIVMIASLLKARISGGRRASLVGEAPHRADENARLRSEVRALHERIAVLERITVEKESSLEREIAKLRDR